MNINLFIRYLNSNNKTMSLSWKTISQFSFFEPPEIVLVRSAEMDKKYTDQITYLNGQGISSLEYLSNKYFSGLYLGNPCTISLNQFPYDIENKVKHYLVWVNPNYQGKYRFRIEDFGFVRNWILNKFCNGCEEMLDLHCVYFQNIERLRSVKAIPHLHVFIRQS